MLWLRAKARVALVLIGFKTAARHSLSDALATRRRKRGGHTHAGGEKAP